MAAQIDSTAPGRILLVAELIRDTPSLPKALCRNRPATFDITDPGLADEAVELCNRCIELHRCRIWFDGLPARQRPAGVVAGLVRA